MTDAGTEASRQMVVEFYESACRGDFAKAMTCVADDVILNEPAFLPYGGTYRGVADLQRIIGKIAEHMDISALTIKKVSADGDTVFANLQIPDRKTGKPVEILERSIVRNGKIAELKIFYFEAGSLIEAGLKR